MIKKRGGWAVCVCVGGGGGEGGGGMPSTPMCQCGPLGHFKGNHIPVPFTVGYSPYGTVHHSTHHRLASRVFLNLKYSKGSCLVCN